MAKKKATKKASARRKSRKPDDANKQATDQSQFALRLRSDLYEQLKSTADQAGMSMNQLIQGMCEACIANAHVGEAVAIASEDGVYTTRKETGCLYFGPKTGSLYQTPKGKMSGNQVEDEYGIEALDDEIGTLMGVDYIGFRGNIWFGLDYSGRGYRRY